MCQKIFKNLGTLNIYEAVARCEESCLELLWFVPSWQLNPTQPVIPGEDRKVE